MIVLIGTRHSKRTDYFLRAAGDHGIPVRFMDWSELSGINVEQELKGAAVKLDPPSYSIVELSVMERRLADYREALRELDGLPCTYLNRPEAVRQVLDKSLVKRELQKKGIAVTEMLAEGIHSAGELLERMDSLRCYNVFLKPVFFSGAAGVAAFRMQPASGKMKLYTSSRLQQGKLCNTKKIFCLEKKEEIMAFLDALSAMDIMVERWYPKDTFGGKSYDLRVVFQFGHIAHIVVRRSDGPITNLHLNNQAESIGKLGLSGETFAEIGTLCREACGVFGELRSAGVDVMLDKGSRKPRIIEINGQGDLIYQDIYNKNRIYEEQVFFLEQAVETGWI